MIMMTSEEEWMTRDLFLHERKQSGSLSRVHNILTTTVNKGYSGGVHVETSQLYCQRFR